MANLDFIYNRKSVRQFKNTPVPKEDIIERGILLDSQDLINPEKVKKYKDSDILISVYNNTINIVMNKKDQK